MPVDLAFADLTCPQCGYALTGLPRRTCPECGGAFDMALIERASRRQRRRRWMMSALVMAIAMYAPFSWLLWGGVWSDSQHWLWLTLWPILPGLPVTILLRFVAHAQLPDWGGFVCMGIFTLAALLLFTWLGTRGRGWLVTTAIIVLALSGYNGWIGYVLFRI